MTRGRQATDPTELPQKGWYDIALRVKDRVAEDRLSLIAAGVAFFGMLALFPALTALLAVGGLFLERQTILEALNDLRGIAPDEVLEIIEGQANEVAATNGLGLALLISVGLALWSASRGVNVMFVGLNVAYEEDENRSFIKKTLHVVSLTALMIVGAILCLLILAGLPAVLSIVPLGSMSELFIQIAGYAVLLAFVVLGLAVLYRYGPARDDAKWKWVTPGALFACIAWIVASAGFTIYVANFANYNESFGALAGVIILLMWLWITCLVILVGAEINAEMEHQTKRDTTSGKPEPMGERGAYKADSLGETYG